MLIILAAVLLNAPAALALSSFPAEVLQATAPAQTDGYVRALKEAAEAIKSAPSDPTNYLRRAQLYDSHEEYAKAAEDYSEIIKLDPKNAEAWQRRGEVNFKAGKIADSISDFDHYLTLRPDQKPYHWQRGIALYYAGRFKEGRDQFALHQTVNPHDVENAVWHFLCTARADGLEAARRNLIPIEEDARVPMAQVHQLFAGKATPDDVLAAARNAPPQSAGEPIFYANLYLGLYYEATGDQKQARACITKAAARYKQNNYMGQVARIHAALLTTKKPTPSSSPYK